MSKESIYEDDDFCGTKENLCKCYIRAGDAIDMDDAEEMFYRGLREGYIKQVRTKD